MHLVHMVDICDCFPRGIQCLARGVSSYGGHIESSFKDQISNPSKPFIDIFTIRISSFHIHHNLENPARRGLVGHLLQDFCIKYAG